MFIVSYLAQDDSHVPAIRARLALATYPKGVVTAFSVAELISQVQTMPVSMVIADLQWPRAVWSQLTADLHALQPNLPIVAVTTGPTDHEWWRLADDLLRLDEDPDLFLYRLERLERNSAGTAAPQFPVGGSPAHRYQPAQTSIPCAAPAPISFLDNPQFRQFASIFSVSDESTVIESFVAWIQQTCHTSRVVMLLRDPGTGDFDCRAQRGLPSTLIPHCRFPQTAPLCSWLMSTSHIVLRDDRSGYLPPEVIGDLDLMQAVVAVPVLLDGQLVGILGVGPRLVGQGYSANELEGLFALAGQVAMVLQHQRTHRTVQTQKEMTEHMLSVIPTGIVVLGQQNRIAFANATAGAVLDRAPRALIGMDLRALPSPLGDMAFESLQQRHDLPHRELMLAPSGRPIRVGCHFLDTNPPSSMLLMEDLSAQQRLEQEQERRSNLEMVTNLVRYLAHELRNPLVALSTFSRLAPDKADDEDFRQFSDTVIPAEIERVNVILEQLLVLTNHAEFKYTILDIGTLLRRITSTPDMQLAVEASSPVDFLYVHGDMHRLETAIICTLRTLMRLAAPWEKVALTASVEEGDILLHAAVTVAKDVQTERLLHPWQQLAELSEQVGHDVDFGLATARFILEQHSGTLSVSVTNNVLVCLCRLPRHRGSEDKEVSRNGANSISADR